MEWNEIVNRKQVFNDIITPLVLEASRMQVNVYPRGEEVFKALDLTPFKDVKVCIIGQDPYHTHNTATGLAFSVARDQKIPPSLLNIYKELHRDTGTPIPTHGDLSSWAKQGVLLLNTVLTVEQGMADSHKGKGWEEITGKIITELTNSGDHVIFVLWGKKAEDVFQKYACKNDNYEVLRSSHPSPFSASRGFRGCGHFSQINRYLSERGKTPINWSIE